MYHRIKNPPQWLLDGLYAERRATMDQPCHDCRVMPGTAHLDGCDTARCLNTGMQRLMCVCDFCGDDVWTGMWPGIQECYEQGLVSFDTISGTVDFDLNEEARRRQGRNIK